MCLFCLSRDWSLCGGPIGGWKIGNTLNGAQAEYLLVPDAQANLAKIPDQVSDEQVLLLSDIASTGFSASESAHLRLGDMVAGFAQGPIGLCATLGAKLNGAGLIIAVEADPGPATDRGFLAWTSSCLKRWPSDLTDRIISRGHS